MSQRDTRTRTREDDRKDKPAAPKELKQLIKTGVNDFQVMQQLRKQYPNDDDMVSKIFDAYKERLDLIKRKADKFKFLIFSKYNTLALPQLMEKAKKYKTKYEFSDDEFHLFFNMAISDKAFASTNMYNVPNTPMSKTLGFGPDATTGFKPKENEMDILQDILKLYAEGKSLHTQVLLQSTQYADCGPEALTGTYDRSKHNPYSFIHPVLAALFIPKIKYIDEHMLIANIAHIIESRYKNIPIMTQPEYELYWDLITDPNEVACVSSRDSPLADIKSRVLVQMKLWESIISLRRGQYYNDRLTDFMLALDKCGINVFDAPDFALVKDEGTVLRKLLGVFSLRPTIVTTSPVYGTMSGYVNMNPSMVTQVTSIPMIILRLPTSQTQNYKMNLSDSLEQPQWFFENRLAVPKTQTIVYSRDVVFFYANRRYQSVNYARVNAPYNFSALPATVSNFETLNDTPIDYSNDIEVGNETFHLRSVIFVEHSHTDKNLIIGSTAGIVVRADHNANRYDDTYLVYDPQSCAVMADAGQAFVNRRPISWIPGQPGYVGDVENTFYGRASTQGTIFMFAKDHQPLN